MSAQGLCWIVPQLAAGTPWLDCLAAAAATESRVGAQLLVGHRDQSQVAAAVDAAAARPVAGHASNAMWRALHYMTSTCHRCQPSGQDRPRRRLHMRCVPEQQTDAAPTDSHRRTMLRWLPHAAAWMLCDLRQNDGARLGRFSRCSHGHKQRVQGCAWVPGAGRGTAGTSSSSSSPVRSTISAVAIAITVS